MKMTIITSAMIIVLSKRRGREVETNLKMMEMENLQKP